MQSAIHPLLGTIPRDLTPTCQYDNFHLSAASMHYALCERKKCRDPSISRNESFSPDSSIV
ncbi:predicted protein [Botrytis cinerea T4]|uniref:Uncharacterized protein n=1 Tax=Botryotinia fuckeliana (strain T4) TaxID=999810 RepID=G2YZ59_BOTF4|nr:predicted protein [Botrytis cinerea T4]